VVRLLRSVTVLMMAFLYTPIVIIAVESFRDAGHPTTRWYAALARDAADHLAGARNVPLIAAFGISVAVAACTTALSVAIGTCGAWALHRWRLPGERLVHALATIPLAAPEVVIGVSLLVLFRSLRVDLGFFTIVTAHTTFSIPFVLATVRARLADLDPALEDAALDLGATPARALTGILLPYLAPAITASALLVFALSMDELIVTTFTRGPHTPTLPTQIYGMARVGLSPTVDAVSTLLVALTVVLVVLGERARRAPVPSPSIEAQ
jgi:spermidine/putrescine transport system permease protein